MSNSTVSVVALVVALVAPQVFALTIPQAPVITYGYIRNEYGTPMTKAQSGVLELVRSDAREGRVYARCDVGTMEVPGMNYRLSLEVDSGSGGRENAVETETEMFIRALVGGKEQDLSPTSTFVVESPGAVRRIDYTIGKDDDHDGMPDAWEKWVLAMAGRRTTREALEAFKPGDDDDGDGMTNIQEYLAGTDPFLSTDIVKITSFERTADASRVKVTFNTSVNRTFRIVVSPTLEKPAWVPVAASETPEGELTFGTIVGDGYEKTFYIGANSTSMFVRVAVN